MWSDTIAKIFRQALEFFWGKGEKLQQQPKVTTDANTPQDVRDALNQSVTDFERMRDKDHQGH
jgi:hypothetical protein